MIRFERMNLLDADVDYICHQVNCMGKMNSGVAKAIRERWPIVYTEYMEMYFKKTDLLGQILIVNLDNLNVINMFSQFNYGYDGKRYTSYDAFDKCLNEIKSTIPKGSKLAFPYKIGSDRGGANWNVILAMINEIVGIDYDVVICYLEEDDWLKWAKLGEPKGGVK